MFIESFKEAYEPTLLFLIFILKNVWPDQEGTFHAF